MNKAAELNFKFKVSSLEQTVALAKVVAEHLLPGSLIGLSGPLGVGKTEFVRAAASALGVEDRVLSPSFVLETIYEVSSGFAALPGLKSVHHWDLFRIAGQMPDELYEYRGNADKITFVEWPEKAAQLDVLLDLKILIDFPSLWASERPLEIDKGNFDDGLREIVVCSREQGALSRALRAESDQGL